MIVTWIQHLTRTQNEHRGHCSLVVERSPLVHEVRGSKSDSGIWVHFSIRDWKTLSVHPGMGGYLALFRAGEGQKGDEERNWPPYLIISWPCTCVSLQCTSLRCSIVWDYLYLYSPSSFPHRCVTLLTWRYKPNQNQWISFNKRFVCDASAKLWLVFVEWWLRSYYEIGNFNQLGLWPLTSVSSQSLFINITDRGNRRHGLKIRKCTKMSSTMSKFLNIFEIEITVKQWI